MKHKIETLIKNIIILLQKEGGLPKFKPPDFTVERPEKEIYGDYSTNVALQLAKITKKEPMEIAKILKSRIFNLESKLFKKIDIAGPGFLNFFLSQEILYEGLGEILKKEEDFGQLDIGKNKKIQVEFISANPTGPLTMGNGRGGFVGDCLANVLKKTGYKTEREYYINDRGAQVEKLGKSVYLRAQEEQGQKVEYEEELYQGDYIKEIAREVLKKKILGKGISEEKAIEKCKQFALKKIIFQTKEFLDKKAKIKYDVWFSEQSLYDSGEVEKILRFLKENKLSYKEEGALWLRTSKFDDVEDRVLIKKDGEATYLLSDVAYFKNRMERGFDLVINLWGADHHGYITRFKSLVKALGYKEENWKILLMQLVHLVKDGKELRMSKRKGVFVTLEWLIDEVGLDVARFFFLMRASDTHLNFDLDLAKIHTEKNPVYYVQYASARIHSILEKSQIPKTNPPAGGQINSKFQTSNSKFLLLNHPTEFALIKQLMRFPEIVEDTARDYQVQRITKYARDLATAFHQFYTKCRVLSEDEDLTKARLSLILATKIVLKNTLDLMGISAPKKM